MLKQLTFFFVTVVFCVYRIWLSMLVLGSAEKPRFSTPTCQTKWWSIWYQHSNMGKQIYFFLSSQTPIHTHEYIVLKLVGMRPYPLQFLLRWPEQKHTGSFSQKYCDHIQSKKKKWSQIGGTYVYTDISPITLGYTWYNPLKGKGHGWRLLQGPRSKFGGVFWSPNFWILEDWGMYACMDAWMYVCHVCM